MYLIPFSDAPGIFHVFVVLEEDNLERIVNHDPPQITFPMAGFESYELRDVRIAYVSKDELKTVLKLVQEQKIKEVLDLLMRGFEFLQT